MHFHHYLQHTGSQIIHMMLLVVDITKGMQTQTAECLVIGEVMCKNMIVVLNKIDLLPPEKRSASIEKVCIVFLRKSSYCMQDRC